MKTLEQLGRQGWTPYKNGLPTSEELTIGILQRIATATEAMAQRHTELIRDCDNYKRWYEGAYERAERIERQRTALRGVVTRLRRERRELRAEVDRLKGELK